MPGVETKEELGAGGRISAVRSQAGPIGDSTDCRPDGVGIAIAAKALMAFLSRDIRIPGDVATKRQKLQDF
jgi:hypothetical protein